MIAIGDLHALCLHFYKIKNKNIMHRTNKHSQLTFVGKHFLLVCLKTQLTVFWCRTKMISVGHLMMCTSEWEFTSILTLVRFIWLFYPTIHLLIFLSTNEIARFKVKCCYWLWSIHYQLQCKDSECC